MREPNSLRHVVRQPALRPLERRLSSLSCFPASVLIILACFSTSFSHASGPLRSLVQISADAPSPISLQIQKWFTAIDVGNSADKVQPQFQRWQPMELHYNYTSSSDSLFSVGQVAGEMESPSSWSLCPFRVQKQRPLLSRFGVLAPEFSGEAELLQEDSPITAEDATSVPTVKRRFETALQSPTPSVPALLAFKGNGGRGVKTQLTEHHVLEINPRWLDFSMFDSMNLCMTEKPPGPGEGEPQLWRSTFTVGVAVDWHLARSLGLHAGYRFYNNPVPADISYGAFPNASQHVVAMAMTLREGPHSVALTYGLDFLVADSGSSITSARQGDDIDPLAHLVSLAYNYSF